jgi:hypothetical protein
MVTFLNPNGGVSRQRLENSQQTLQAAIAIRSGDPPLSIPFLVRLLENPASPIALPGKINLYGHDCLHILLNRGQSLSDEAFVVGFTMGNDEQTNWLHLLILKVFASRFYPPKYRFNQDHLKIFDLGVAYGRAVKVRNLNQLDFSSYQTQPLESVRQQLGIDSQDLRMLEQMEEILSSSN